MSTAMTLEQKAEAIARRIARGRGMPESLWQLFLMDAYKELFPVPADTQDTSTQEEP